ncbi:hypothetical protein CTAYLR_001749 [Chrysophaeum taylorii]|uniref:Mitochondrial presequence protease n=1 Tax=Chrysophaeum taylorii TaxID=2483200 RepID=A0AAD7UH90_9STRA|nr:hypothetical protein CTAYLR_001749 [Chrysophaeum taylorii]
MEMLFGSQWKEEGRIALESGAEIRMWMHGPSKARLRVISTAGPMVNLYAVIATEAVTNEYARCDDGLPHTLEHLVFLGSSAYPYKGVLDKVANRCLARGTNAWTDVDHTAYTATTAGSKGLLELLPIYLDHILRPTLTDAGFVTEVHHVTGSGEDKGVVYCEMQGRETAAESLAERACLGALYPGSGYSSETGGLCANLRDLTNAQVRRYHADYYRTENLCLIVTGSVDQAELLEAAHDALVSAAKKEEENGTPLPRPWGSPVGEVELPSSPITVEFPSGDESTGMVVVAWRGERYESFFEDAKTGMLWNYLTDGAASPLAKAFEHDCSGVFPAADRFRVGYRQLWFDDVPSRRLNEIAAELDVAFPERVDIDRMRDVVDRAMRRTLALFEDDPATAMVSPLVKHFLYDENPGEPRGLAETDALRLLDAVSRVGQQEWDASLRKLKTAPRVVVVAKPSIKKAAEQRDDELRRVEEHKKNLDLESLATYLRDAIDANETPIPHEVLVGAVSPPDIQEAKDKMFRVEHTVFGKNWRRDVVDGTRFCRVDVCADCERVGGTRRAYLPLLAEAIMKAPIKQKDGTIVPYDVAVEELRRDTVSYGAGVGLAGGGTSELFFVGSKVAKDKGGFATGLKVATRAIHQAVLQDPERVKAAVSKLSLELQSELRDGNSVARNVLRALVFDPSTNQGLLVSGRQKRFLDAAKWALSPLGVLAGARSRLLRDLEQTRADLFLSDEAPLSCRTSGDSADDALDFFNGRNPVVAKRPLFQAFAGKIALVGVASLEGGSSYVARCARGPYLQDPDLAALAVCIEYLTALEGDFWTRIRGAGLAYGAGLRADASNGLVHFTLYRSVDPVKAMVAARDIVLSYDSGGAAKIRDLDFENARGSLASGLIETEKTRSQALAASWRRGLLGLSPDRDRDFLDAVSKVDKNQAIDALRTYITPLFRDKDSITVISCAPAKLDTIARDLDSTVPVAKYRDVNMAFRALDGGGGGGGTPPPPPTTTNRWRLLGGAAAISAVALVAILATKRPRRL